MTRRARLDRLALVRRRLRGWLPWVRRRAGRDAKQPRCAAAETGRQMQRQEYDAAVQRIIDASQRRNERHDWHHATLRLPLVRRSLTAGRPLMTPGQAWRGNGGHGRTR